MRGYTIFAPHADDELIGCFSLLNDRLIDDVCYFYDLDETRKKEIWNTAAIYGFVPHFMDSECDYNVPDDFIILAPNIADEHPHHKIINGLAKTYPNKKIYYSIDMNVKKLVLPNFQRKKEALAYCYPSQQKLFDSNDKYHLFESLVDDDSSKMIWVKFQKEGIHCYPAALIEPALADVKFLGYDHRHIFHFKVWIEVFHNDRDLEFIQFKRWLESIYDEGLMEMNHRSCEMLADELYFQIAKRYPGRKVKIEISEDGENGCEVVYGS